MKKTIIQPQGKSVTFRVTMKEKSQQLMKDYMQFAAFMDEGDFIEQCIQFTVEKDKAFQSSVKAKIGNPVSD